MSTDLHRWVSLENAARRLPIRRADARALLRQAGLVQRIAGRQVVWLADVRDLHLIAPVPWHRVHRQYSLTLVRSMSVIATPVQLAGGHQMARAPRARKRGCTLSFSSSNH